MSIQKPSWSYNEFLAYLLLYATKADLIVDEREKEMIFAKVDIEEYNHIRREFEEANDYEYLQTILSFRSTYFNDEASVEQLLNDLKDIFLADHHFDSAEWTVFIGLRKLLK